MTPDQLNALAKFTMDVVATTLLATHGKFDDDQATEAYMNCLRALYTEFGFVMDEKGNPAEGPKCDTRRWRRCSPSVCSICGGAE